MLPPMLATAIGRLRLLGMVEGASFIVLLGIAMPLKYVAGYPIAVRVVGLTHGVLFILFSIALFHVWQTRPWTTGRAALVLLAALLPFGPFVIDRRLREEW
jgi:integral membrane protein